MEGNLFSETEYNSYLACRPLVSALKKNIAEGNPGMKKLYGQVVTEIESRPELLQPIEDLSTLDKHTQLIEELLSAVFPPTTTNLMYGVSLPFKFQAVYVSPLFKTSLLKPGSNEINVPENQIGLSLTQEKLNLAYGLLLKKYL